ncbi:nitrate- and nitrite sensing domain-containing protein [Streptomyces sp. NPDC058045]|uniref:sensor histidine kinase n=1 Tax=Streptomyces sp. NPDC058045 TaxID=3346311 RepID=UPI0036E79449
MRLGRKGRQQASDETTGRPPGTPAPREDTAQPAGRRVRVRSRLVIAVAVVAAAVAGAGAPAIIAASGQVHDTQELVDLSERTGRALTLAHALADERDEVTAFIAAGRPKGKGLSERRSAPVDRQIAELRPGAPAPLADDLDAIAAVRRAALTGKGSALDAHRSYADVIGQLHGLAEDLAQQEPPRAGGGAAALADLDTAVAQASATRGLLLAALAVPGETRTVIDPATGLPTEVSADSGAAKQQDELTAAAQQAHVAEQAALASFHGRAPDADRSAYDTTVTGPEVAAAEKYLARLADSPELSASEKDTDPEKLDAALTARIDQMRGSEASLANARSKTLAGLRDDDVTALELRIALVGVCLLAAVGVAMGTARSLTRPLSVLRLGSARLAEDPATEEPIRFTGRNDEFAQVVRSVNGLHTHALGLHERIGTLEADRKHLVGQRESMADERTELRAALKAATADLERVRGGIQSTFVSLALRTLGLVERQLAVIEKLEDREQDPDRLSTLFTLDHLATVMRRHSENLLVLAGADRGHQHPGPVPLVDVVRAAVSEIERYERVRIAALPPHAHTAGFAADDLSHLLAELLENATSFSPPDAEVEVSGWLMENGEMMVSIQDEGIGMTPERMDTLNDRLSGFDPDQEHRAEDEGLGLGLYVVARLAHRHGARIRLREQKQGGVAAVVVLPTALLVDAPAAAVAPAPQGGPGGGSAVHLSGAEAEANSNELPTRQSAPGADPLITAAEASLAAASPEDEPALADATPADEAVAAAPAEEAEAEATQLPADTEKLTEADGGATAPDEPAQAAAEPPAPGLYAIGPERHERTADEAERPAQAAGEQVPPQRTAGTPEQEAPRAERITDKGLPKRTPRLSEPSAVPGPRTGPVDADALRRRLGGFHQGAVAGRRDVAAELAAEQAESTEQAESADPADQAGTPGASPGRGADEAAAGRTTDTAQGDTVEEASS